MTALEELREKWNSLYRSELPAKAKARDPAQKHWPVFLDHCFARIVLDNAVGLDKPWTEVVKSPAVKNMTEQQLKDAIALGENLISGKANLIELDERSLELRGKSSKAGKKRKGELLPVKQINAQKKQKTDGSISKYFAPSPESPQRHASMSDQNVESKADISETAQHSTPNLTATESAPDMTVELDRIASSTKLTPFRKQTLSMLCQIPPGRYSTYQAMSDYISATSHKTCARAVGSAMRNNPFAPEVPCHRILAADGSLGGFGGHWGESGKFASKKHELLHKEGVRFDSNLKVKGPPFRDFHKVRPS